MTLWDEIQEQPATLAGLLHDGRGDVSRFSTALDRSDVGHVVVAARGTSDNAARYAQYVWGARNRLTVALAAPSLFGAYRRPPSLAGALVVGISQSGRSPDLVAVMEEARAQDRPTLAITNDLDSPMAAASESVLPLRAGPELAVAATKTYTAELLAIAMVSVVLGHGRNGESALDAIPGTVAEMLRSSARIEELAGQYGRMDRCVVLARGFNHATAFEWALKLQELCYVVAHPFSTADFEHGPVAIVEPGLPVLAVAPRGPLHPGVHGLLTRLRNDLGADLATVSDAPETLGLGGHGIALPPGIPEWLSPIVGAVAVQLFCYHLAAAKGLRPDVPRGLHKVTRTL